MQSKSVLNRILAMALCLALVLSFVPGTIFSAKAAEPAEEKPAKEAKPKATKAKKENK